LREKDTSCRAVVAVRRRVILGRADTATVSSPVVTAGADAVHTVSITSYRRSVTTTVVLRCTFITGGIPDVPNCAGGAVLVVIIYGGATLALRTRPLGAAAYTDTAGGVSIGVDNVSMATAMSR
jgi:hypothetical protein